ncbi:MAG: phosphate acyltransferase PlsX [Firmicutes bacterium]|nr:phosphate acyltransferase PlsX [Bacillota bacterium]
MRLALDAMGGDHAPAEIIAGGLKAVEELDDLFLYLIGPEEILQKHLREKTFPQDRVKLIHAPEVITNDDAPVMAVRRKRNSSMMTALTLVKEKKADVMASAGNTGALMAGAVLITKRLPGIDRPALTVVAPTFNGDNVVLLDMGANMDAKADNLLQYGIMGKIYAREVLQKKSPRVALLNVGEEEIKGNEQVKKAFSLLQKNLPEFVGNIEARDVLQGAADVVVCDGFVGNILLKTIEGVAAGLFALLKDTFSQNLKNKIGAALLLPELKRLKAKLDYAEYGGAPLLGVGCACIKCHGSSDARAIYNALVGQAYRFARQDVNGQISKELADLQRQD